MITAGRRALVPYRLASPTAAQPLPDVPLARPLRVGRPGGAGHQVRPHLMDWKGT
jgi:hypothetical protein